MSNKLESLKAELERVNNSRVRLQTLIDQAENECKQIEAKYNITSLEQLQELVNKTELECQQQIQQAQKYIQECDQIFATYIGIL